MGRLVGAGPRRRRHDRADGAAHRIAPSFSAACAPRRWVEGRRADGSFGVLWLTPQATEMTEQDWNFPEGRFLSYVLGPVQQDGRAALHRAQRRAADHRVHASHACPNTAAGRRCCNTAPRPRPARSFRPARRRTRRPRSRSGVLGLRHDGRARFGAELTRGGVTFRLWAPAAKRVELMLDRAHPMQAGPEGWYEVTIRRRAPARSTNSASTANSRCRIRPRISSRRMCSGPSEVIDHERFEWRTHDWRGRPWQRCGDPRASRRHVHARRHLSRGDREARSRASRPGSPRSN